ncbi:SURF1 family cytochrome oxidase biogenesis protein [Sinomonas halotolerans]|uniref:SURF1-like protein n=1 Tax=Sinomonas halotolerans TaxID=1644133 RepID=A0ABU9X4X9_9MICC
MYRFLFTRRWLTYLGIAALFAVACVFLSRWQMARLDEARAVVDRVEQNYDAPALPFAQAAGQFSQLDIASEWRPVALRGTYDVEQTRVVRNRPLNGQPGYEVVVPLRLTSGETVVVDRGWLPIGNAESGRPDAVPAPPEGTVDVVVRLRPAEPALDRGAPQGQLASIDLAAYSAELPYPVLTGAYGQLASEDPAPAETPAPLPRPQPNEGTHLSYALQWLAFGVLMFVAFGWAARQQARNDAIDAAADAAEAHETAVAEGRDDAAAREAAQRAAAKAARLAPRKPRRRTAEEEEDAILDAQGYQ